MAVKRSSAAVRGQPRKQAPRRVDESTSARHNTVGGHLHKALKRAEMQERYAEQKELGQAHAAMVKHFSADHARREEAEDNEVKHVVIVKNVEAKRWGEICGRLGAIAEFNKESSYYDDVSELLVIVVANESCRAEFAYSGYLTSLGKLIRVSCMRADIVRWKVQPFAVICDAQEITEDQVVQSVKDLAIPLLDARKSNNRAWMVVELFSEEDLDRYIATPTILNGVKWYKAQSYQSYGSLSH